MRRNNSFRDYFHKNRRVRRRTEEYRKKKMYNKSNKYLTSEEGPVDRDSEEIYDPVGDHLVGKIRSNKPSKLEE